MPTSGCFSRVPPNHAATRPVGVSTMAEYDRDRMDQAQDAVQERNIVRDGGVARSDADIADVSRDSYGSPIGPDGDDDRETTDEDRTRAKEVLGIGDVSPGGGFA